MATASRTLAERAAAGMDSYENGTIRMKAVILAGGRGTRLAEETGLRPKPMVEIGGRPILWHIMKSYSHHGINEFVVCLGYMGYFIKEYFANYVLHRSDVTIDMQRRSIDYHENMAEPWKITLVDTGEETQTGGRLKRIKPWVADDEAFLMTYGDGLSDVDVAASIAFHKDHGRKATMTIVRPPGRFGAAEMDGDRVTGFTEKPHGESGYINGGYFVLSPDALDEVDGDETIWERAPLERLVAQDQLRGFRHEGFWQPMDTLREKHQLEALWQGGRAPWKVWD